MRERLKIKAHKKSSFSSLLSLFHCECGCEMESLCRWCNDREIELERPADRRLQEERERERCSKNVPGTLNTMVSLLSCVCRFIVAIDHKKWVRKRPRSKYVIRLH